MQRQASANKILMLGMDGMDPRFTLRMLREGKMPNVQKLLERGAAAEDLVMLGGHPTITPPMWTTLATGCYANVHGITQFSRKAEDLDLQRYNIDSRYCKAEPLWNVFAEAGKKTLVWHWPGSSWPPTSDSPNLFVVDGSSPGSVGMTSCQVDAEFMLGGNVEFKNTSFVAFGATDATAPCVVQEEEAEKTDIPTNTTENAGDTYRYDGPATHKIFMRESQKTTNFTDTPLHLARTPITEPKNWSGIEVPADAKEFTMLFSKGLISRPGLILKDENGKYTKMALYKNKKASEPFAELELGVMAIDVMDEAVKANGTRYRCNRNLRLLKMAEDGSTFTMYVSAAMNADDDSVWHPKRLFKEVVENVGYVPPTSMIGNQSEELITDCMLANWYASADWQAAAMQYVIDNENMEIVFSHFHGVDLQGHMFFKHMNPKPYNKMPVEKFIKMAEDIYVQADYYIGKFLHYLDEGWTILVFSDHGLVSSEYDEPFLGDSSGVNLRVLQQYGLTEVKRDENGNELEEIDWEKTKAVALGECHIWINLKGRDPHGIVDPADKYDVETEVIDALYNYRDPETGKRIVSIAMRNKEAVLVGLGGPDSGDIIYFNEEGFNFDHGDCLSTSYGMEETSVSPIFFAAGPGIKENYRTERIIRQVDFVPTVAVLGGVRMPAQCEGAPAYQILTEEY